MVMSYQLISFCHCLILKPVWRWAGLRHSVHRLGACASDMYNNNHKAPLQGAEMLTIP